MKMQPLAELVGLADPLDPETMQYTARPATSCVGCEFRGQRSAVCHRATALALRADLPDCDHGYIYVLVEQNPRQLSIVP